MSCIHFRAFAEKSNKICVVTVIGKSRFAPFCSKASLLNPVVDRDIFQVAVVGVCLSVLDMMHEIFHFNSA